MHFNTLHHMREVIYNCLRRREDIFLQFNVKSGSESILQSINMTIIVDIMKAFPKSKI